MGREKAPSRNFREIIGEPDWENIDPDDYSEEELKKIGLTKEELKKRIEKNKGDYQFV
jgi:predicted DNA-binding protein (UPF0251 family)